MRLADGRLETFRLYYVDTTESRSRGKRSDDQAAYLRLTHKQGSNLAPRMRCGLAVQHEKAPTLASGVTPFTDSGRGVMEMAGKIVFAPMTGEAAGHGNRED